MVTHESRIIKTFSYRSTRLRTRAQIHSDYNLELDVSDDEDEADALEAGHQDQPGTIIPHKNSARSFRLLPHHDPPNKLERQCFVRPSSDYVGLFTYPTSSYI
jgi:hypothetical protein